MRTLFKILSYFLLLIISLVICLVIILNTFYSDKIEKSVMKNLKSQLISKIDLSSITFSLWEHFPYASVNFNDIIVYESNVFGQDTLLFSKEAHVNLSLFDIALKNYNINHFVNFFSNYWFCQISKYFSQQSISKQKS